MSLLVTYSDSSGDEGNDDNSSASSENVDRKRKIEEITDIGVNSEEEREKHKKKLPSVPEDIQNMFVSEDSLDENLEDHNGRIRSFAHERGNWASHVFLPASSEDALQDLATTIVENLSPHLELNVVDDFHLSLSRTFVLRHHWIDTFIASFRTQLASYKSFVCEFEELEVYCNDEGTRTFVGFKVCAGVDKLKSLSKDVDVCLEEFKLPKYYENPSFHVSIAWALGDVSAKLKSPDIQDVIKKSLAEESEINPQLACLDVRAICCKVGNRLYEIPTVSR